MRWNTPLVVVACCSLLSASCREDSQGPATTVGRACPQALTRTFYNGAGLPPKTLALTFDDGPGARTLELSHWLRGQGIAATFFMNGKMLTDGVAPLQALVADGHVIGNHTQTHADLTTLDAKAVVAEVAATDAIIAPFVPDKRFLFRPPFGAYDDKTFTALQGSPMQKYVGPIDWDIGSMMGPAQAADWDCWSAQGSSVPAVIDVKTCGELYLKEIRAKGHGIVLLHDPYFIDDDPTHGGTVDMIKNIVPILKAEGYTFVNADAVPSIAADLPPLTPKVKPVAGDEGAEGDAGAGDVSDPPPAPPVPTSGGDSTDPCARSPQGSPRNYGESGNLRHR